MVKFSESLVESLSLYVRQLAWWQTTPAAPDDKNYKRVLSRQKLKESRGGAAAFPDAGEAKYLLRYLFDVGTATSGGMGLSPLTSTELWHWQALSAVPLSPWEAGVLLRLSKDYCAEHGRADGKDAVSPWGDLKVCAVEPLSIFEMVKK